MGLTLHNWYTASEAVTAFGGNGTAEALCDGQFVVLPSVVLCFVTTGQTFDEPHVSSPSQVVWRPKLGTQRASPDDNDWLPEKVREVWDRSGPQVRKLRSHLVFVRTPADDRFFYAGDAHLGSYGSTRTTSGEWGLAANFSLSDKLPRDVWLRCENSARGSSTTSRSNAGRSPASTRWHSWLTSTSHPGYPPILCMTRYEEDSLTVHTNARRGWLMCLRYPGYGGVYTRDLGYSGPADAEEVFRCVCGIDLVFEAAQTLPRELAQRAAVEFFQSGRLPECVHWELE